MLKKGLTALAVLLILGVLLGLTQQINQSLGAKGRLVGLEEDVERLQSENMELKAQLKNTKSTEFVEKVARNNLNLAKNNETIFIISDKAVDKALEEKRVEEIKLPNWQGWLRLFI